MRSIRNIKSKFNVYFDIFNNIIMTIMLHKKTFWMKYIRPEAVKFNLQ